MEIDDYLSQLNNDLQSRIDDLNRSLNNVIGGNSDDTISYSPEKETGNYTKGIILTDTRALAAKYNRSQEEVAEMFEQIVNQGYKHGVEWFLLDSDAYSLGSLWLDYNDTISSFMSDHGIQAGMTTPLFIIGGNDVIPIPLVEDPFGSSYGTSFSGRIPCDMCYAFHGTFFEDIWDSDRSVSESNVRNTVSRLPLENDIMKTTMEDDILGYFKRCDAYYKEGIPVDGVMMTSNVSWLPASRTMSEHLPLVQHTDDEDMVFKGMYVCPPVSPDDKETIKPVRKTLKQVGMLLFNLHGADSKRMSGFYSDDGEAFNLDLLNNTKAKVFNTVACFGARFNGYSREESMLLTSLYKNGFLLYCGSLIPVPMTELNIPEGVEVHEGSGSEHLMPIFCMEQYTGKSMGEAMMKAKLEYFNTFRHLERDDFSIATMMMFSLYGDPTLRMQRNEAVLEEARRQHVLPELPLKSGWKNMPIRMKRTRRIWGKGSPSASLLNEIRSAVNANLDIIHQDIQKNLYDYFGLDPKWLDHIDEYEIPNGDGTFEKGFIYAYDDKSRTYGNKVWIEVDTAGKISKTFTTK